MFILFLNICSREMCSSEWHFPELVSEFLLSWYPQKPVAATPKFQHWWCFWAASLPWFVASELRDDPKILEFLKIIPTKNKDAERDMISQSLDLVLAYIDNAVILLSWTCSHFLGDLQIKCCGRGCYVPNLLVRQADFHEFRLF